MEVEKQITLEQMIMKKILSYAHWRCSTINQVIRTNGSEDDFMKEDLKKLQSLTNEIMNLCAYRRTDILFKIAMELKETERRQKNDEL